MLIIFFFLSLYIAIVFIVTRVVLLSSAFVECWMFGKFGKLFCLLKLSDFVPWKEFRVRQWPALQSLSGLNEFLLPRRRLELGSDLLDSFIRFNAF